MFYEDDTHPEIIQMPPAISAIHLEHLYQQKKKLSTPGDKQYNRCVDINW